MELNNSGRHQQFHREARYLKVHWLFLLHKLPANEFSFARNKRLQQQRLRPEPWHAIYRPRSVPFYIGNNRVIRHDKFTVLHRDRAAIWRGVRQVIDNSDLLELNGHRYK